MKPVHGTVKPWIILSASILMQTVLGRVYAWSAIGKALRADYGLSSLQTELIFGLTIGVFAAGTILTGRLIHRTGPRILALASALIYGLSHLAASMSGGSYPILLLALGPALAIAIALGYVCPLSVAVQWFPKDKGIVTGLAVMGFGAGAILDSVLSTWLGSLGLGVLDILAVMGVGGSIVIFLAALVLEFPAPLASPAKDRPDAPTHPHSRHLPDIRSAEGHFMKSRLFWGLAVGMFMATAGGLVVIGKAVTIADEYGMTALGPVAVGLIALGNAGGRLLWGWLMDRFGSRAILVSLAISTAAIGGLALAKDLPWLFLSASFLTGLQFGAALVVFAAFTERYWGPGAIARVYPSIFVWYGLAALVAPPIGGIIHDSMGSFVPAILMAAVMPLAGLVIVYLSLATISQSRHRSGQQAGA